MEDALVQCVQLSLANHVNGNAIFYAEQLVALSRPHPSQPPSDHALHLLATCYMQGGRYAQVSELLKGSVAPKNRFLLGIAALALNHLPDVDAALLPPHGLLSEDDYLLVPNGAYGIYILGMAAKYVSKALLSSLFFISPLLLPSLPVILASPSYFPLISVFHPLCSSF